jgi:transcriptional regulator with XRE-family HTH domain
MDLGLRQIDIAERLAINASLVWLWENNHSQPRPKHYSKIVAFLGYDPEGHTGESISQRLAAYRRKHGLTREQLARRMRIDLGTLLRLDRGKGRTSQKVVAKVNRLLT